MKAKMLQYKLSKPLHYVGQGGWTEQGTRDLHDKI